MPDSKELQKSSYPLPVYNFQVSIDGTLLSFSEITGIQVEHKSVTYRHGFSYAEGEAITSYHLDHYLPVTLKRGMVKDARTLYDWLQKRAVRPMNVSMRDAVGEPVITWKIIKALPVKLDAPSFTADSNEVAIEQLEVMAAGIFIEYH